MLKATVSLKLDDDSTGHKREGQLSTSGCNGVIMDGEEFIEDTDMCVSQYLEENTQPYQNSLARFLQEVARIAKM